MEAWRVVVGTRAVRDPRNDAAIAVFMAVIRALVS